MAAADRPDLDPADWEGFSRLAHALLDEMIEHVRTVRERPVWQPLPDPVRAAFQGPLPIDPTDLDEIARDFRQDVRPHTLGNLHPAFYGWVHGGGTPTGMLAEMLAAGLNANLGGRDHAPVLVERQVVRWMVELFGLPAGAGGLLVTGSSAANLIAVLVARRAVLGADVRTRGLAGAGLRLRAYTSAGAHSCLAKAMDIAGLGSDALRRIGQRPDGGIDLAALRDAVAADRRAGLQPFLVAGTAGTVDTGAIDDLGGLAELCAAERLWLHVDGAFGALAILSPALRGRLAGIERVDSLAFDFHKWLQVPYDAACVLVRDQELQRATFAARPPYLAAGSQGAAAGEPWFADFGPDLSRGFRALKVWFTLREHGTRRLGEVIERNCRQARHLAARIAGHDDLELLAPVALNIVCFRYVRPGLATPELNRLNRDIVEALQIEGTAVPSTTVLGDRLAIRVCNSNHRGEERWLDRLVDRVRALGAAWPGNAPPAGPPEP
jgi:glutamate/tyrosine decarboxylase-like PLP-dependent enzyme